MKQTILLLTWISVVYSRSWKKGLAVPWESYKCGDLKAFTNVRWWYDWNQQPWYFRNKHCPGHPKGGRVPMVWAWRRPYDVPLKIPHNARYVLGFNEPNFKTQANMTPWQAAQHWRKLEKHTHGKKLVSPSAAPCTKGGICIMNSPDWFHEFFNVHCRGCRVDYLATHGYWCDANILMHYLKDLYNRFHKKIWLTEFSCPKTNNPWQELHFMKQALPRLEAARYVYRYSWFATRFNGDGWVTRATSLLKPNGGLTMLGQFYNNF